MDFKPFKMGKYLLMERLATGGMAEVYRAKAGGAGGFEKQVAIKRILPTYSQNDEFRKMFEYEARLSSMLTHANIVQVYDFNKFGETYLLAMEYVDGKNLRQFVNKAKKMNSNPSIEFTVFVMNEVCKGLEYAHSKKDDMTGKPLNIIHRDMSPQNIMLSYEGAIKIVDFGIAKAKDRVDETRSGIIKGKFGYMSPEQANGLPVDHRTDLFSTGIILWEMLTGRRLFTAESDMATLRMIQECVITPPSKLNPRVTPDLERIVMKTLSKDLKLRYNSAGDLHRGLLEYLNKHAPTFTQREASEVLHKTFNDEIAKEKRRFEALYRQSIPFSQGLAKEEEGRDGDDISGVAEVLDGLQTRSDMIEEDKQTFSEQIEPAEMEGQPSAPGSFQLDEEMSALQSKVEIPRQENLTKSQVSVATLLGERPSHLEESSVSREIVLKESDKAEKVDLVLPGGAKPPFADDGPPVPGQKWGDASIRPMEEQNTGSHNSYGIVPEPPTDLKLSEKGTNTQSNKQPPLQDPNPFGKPIAPPRSKRSHAPYEAPATGASPQLERDPNRRARKRASGWIEERPVENPRVTHKKIRRRFAISMIRLLLAAGVTGYVYKLYLDGEIAAFFEKTARDPSQSDSDRTPNADAPADRKPFGECTLNLNSLPTGAQVVDRGRVLGTTPLALTGSCHRTVDLILRRAGYREVTYREVVSQKSQEATKVLKAEARTPSSRRK